MIVNGIEWSHPPIGGKLGYYGFNPACMTARVDDVDLTAWIKTTDTYDSFWAVRLERDGSRLLPDVNFVGKEVALVGASILLGTVTEDLPASA